jgi:hypothetical protein
MAVVCSVSPNCLCAGEPLTVRQYKLRRLVCKPNQYQRNDKKTKERYSPLNLKQWYIVEAHDHILLDPIDCHRTCHDPKSKLGSSPVLLDEVQFAVVFGIKITQMATAFNELL